MQFNEDKILEKSVETKSKGFIYVTLMERLNKHIKWDIIKIQF